MGNVCGSRRSNFRGPDPEVSQDEEDTARIYFQNVPACRLTSANRNTLFQGLLAIAPFMIRLLAQRYLDRNRGLGTYLGVYMYSWVGGRVASL